MHGWWNCCHDGYWNHPALSPIRSVYGWTQKVSCGQLNYCKGGLKKRRKEKEDNESTVAVIFFSFLFRNFSSSFFLV